MIDDFHPYIYVPDAIEQLFSRPIQIPDVKCLTGNRAYSQNELVLTYLFDLAFPDRLWRSCEDFVQAGDIPSFAGEEDILLPAIDLLNDVACPMCVRCGA